MPGWSMDSSTRYRRAELTSTRQDQLALLRSKSFKTAAAWPQSQPVNLFAARNFDGFVLAGSRQGR